MIYNPLDWYWLADDGRVFSSARQALVARDDKAWLERQAEGAWTSWPRDDTGEQSDAALQWVFDNAAVQIFVDLSMLKMALKRATDAAAEAERLKYITPGAGQAMTYLQKADEAARFLAATNPDAADYPLLSAEVGITAPDIAGVASVVDAAFRRWQVIGRRIEAVRLKAKFDIEAASNAGDAGTAFASITWPT